MRQKTERSQDVVIFKKICTDLFKNSSSGHTFDEIVNMVLKTKYGNFARTDDLVLEDIAFIYDISRERVRQIETAILKKLKTPRFLKNFSIIKTLRDDKSVGWYNSSEIKARSQRTEEKRKFQQESNAIVVKEKKERDEKRKSGNSNPMNLLGRIA
jgi:hypothetical protein